MRPIIIFVLLYLFFDLSAKAQATDSLFMDASIVKLKHAKDYTMEVAKLMPKEKYIFRPTAEEMSFAEQLLHLAQNMKWLCSSYLDGSANQAKISDSPLEKDATIQLLKSTYDYAIMTLQNFKTSHLSDTVSFFAGPMNKLQIINLLNDHQTHHRAQLLVYLRINGIKPPNYVGW